LINTYLNAESRTIFFLKLWSTTFYRLWNSSTATVR